MIQVLVREEDSIFDEDGARSQDERGKQVDVDVVPGAVELPRGEWRRPSLNLKQFRLIRKEAIRSMSVIHILPVQVSLPEGYEHEDGRY